MTFRIVRRLLLSSGILLLPVVAYAQEATSPAPSPIPRAACCPVSS